MTDQSDRGERGNGTALPMTTRAGVVTGWKALLPRNLSQAPPGHANPKAYRQAIGIYPTEAEARQVLIEAIRELRKNPYVGPGDTFAMYADLELAAREAEAFRNPAYPTPARARQATAGARNIRNNWIAKAPFVGEPPRSVTADDVQDWVNWLTNTARTKKKGTPLSGSLIRAIVSFAAGAFGRVKALRPNPAHDLELPKRSSPKVPYLRIDSQRALLGRLWETDGKPLLTLADRIMIGCGMGTGLRIGELLSVEASCVHLDGEDPYLEVNFGGPDRQETKGRERRIVQLFEPGLGFWRLWMAHCYRPGARLVFEGPRRGYMREWPKNFPNWSTAAGFPGMTSHIMRHTYAVSMLSGLWGYEPRSLEFVSKQLGHRSVKITEDHYGKFDQGFSRETVRRMTGRGEQTARVIVTANDLLGLVTPVMLGSAFGSAVSVSDRKHSYIRDRRQKPQFSDRTPKTPSKPLILPPSLDRRSNHSGSWISVPEGPPLAGWFGPSPPPAVAQAFDFLDAGPALRRDLPELAAAADSADADAFADAFGRAAAEHAASLPGLSA